MLKFSWIEDGMLVVPVHEREHQVFAIFFSQITQNNQIHMTCQEELNLVFPLASQSFT